MSAPGQPLYQIDPSLYRAAANQAQANLASARANADAAVARAGALQAARRDGGGLQAGLHRRRGASARRAGQRRAERRRARDRAHQLALHDRSAPISGRIGRSLFTVGALVSANQADPLAVIQRLDPIYVDMQQSAADLTALRRGAARGDVAAGQHDGAPHARGRQRLRLHRHSPVLRSLGRGKHRHGDLARDASPTRRACCSPACSCSAVFDQAIQPNAFLVPQPALQRDFDGSAFVYIVGPGNKALRRKIAADRTIRHQLGRHLGPQAGDKVITQGLANLKAGRKVRPVPASAPQRVAVPKVKPGGGWRWRTRARGGRAEPACRASSSTGRSSPGCWPSS